MKTIKRTLSVLLTLLMLMSVAPLGAINASAENSYPKISALNMARVYQSDSSASLCTWCSMATVQGYCLGEYTYGGKTTSYRVPGNEYEYGAAKGKRDAVTEYFRDNFSGYYNTSANLKKYPFPMEMKKNPGADVYKLIYNQLKAGKPVIIYRKARNKNDSNHASVVIAYNGSDSKLEPSGFTIMEINRNVTKNSAALFEKYANNPQTKYSTSCYLKLSTWLDGREVLHIIYPKAETISAAKTLTVTLRGTSHIETNAATVHLTAWNPEKKVITARGVQVKKKGASDWAKSYSEDLSKKTYNKDTMITGYFDIGSGKEVNYALSAGTTYEYRCFVTSGGKNYYSNVSTFTTLPPQNSTSDSSFSKVWASDITDTNATINAQLKSTTSVKSTGFYFGTSESSLKKITKNLKGKADAAGKVKKIYFGLNGWYGKLTPDTTYYYKIFYTNSSGKECASKVDSFKTTGGNKTENNFTIKFDASGGTGSMAAMTVSKDKDFSLPNNQFAKAGHSFAGWTVKRSSDNKWYVPEKGWNTEKEIKEKGFEKKIYNSNTEYRFNNGWINGTRNSDTYTFYAVWKACEHSWDGGKVTKEPTASANGVMTYTCERCGKTKTETIPKQNAFTLKFASNGGKGTMAAMKVEKDAFFTLPEAEFSKAGAAFGGWNVKRASDSKWYTTDGTWETAKEIKANDLEKEVFDAESEYELDETWINGTKTADTYTFYAVWIACEHSWDEGEVTKEPTVEATGVMTYTCELCGKTKTEKIPKLPSYQIKYAANGGKGKMAGVKVLQEEPFTLPDCEFIRDGYSFVGWTVKRSSDSKWRTEEDDWKTDKEIKTEDLTKLVFDSDDEIELDEDWLSGIKSTDTYTFYANWEKD